MLAKDRHMPKAHTKSNNELPNKQMGYLSDNASFIDSVDKEFQTHVGTFLVRFITMFIITKIMLN